MESIDKATGKTVKTITEDHPWPYSSLILGDSDGPNRILIEFTDGSTLKLWGGWRNDSTADVEAEWA